MISPIQPSYLLYSSNNRKSFSISAFVTSILICTSIMCFVPAEAAQFDIKVANACSKTTAPGLIHGVPVARPLIGFSGEYLCVEKGSEIEFSVLSIEVTEDELGGGKVAIVLAPGSAIRWNALEANRIGSSMVLLLNEQALLSIRLNKTIENGTIVLYGFSLSEATLIGRVLQGIEYETAKGVQ
jgi:hypothetical protein